MHFYIFFTLRIELTRTFLSFDFQLNYMDPRISVAWCKRNDVPIERVFSKTMRDKFNWAMAVPPEWLFNEEIAKQG